MLGLVLAEQNCRAEAYLVTWDAGLLVLAQSGSCPLGLLLGALALVEMCVPSVAVLQAMSGHRKSGFLAVQRCAAVVRMAHRIGTGVH